MVVDPRLEMNARYPDEAEEEVLDQGVLLGGHGHATQGSVERSAGSGSISDSGFRIGGGRSVRHDKVVGHQLPSGKRHPLPVAATSGQSVSGLVSGPVRLRKHGLGANLHRLTIAF